MNLELTPAIESGKDVLAIEHLAKQFDEEPLFTDLNFEIKRGEKVAIIGDNGTGKTTILKILNGIVTPDAGQFKLGSNVEIGYYDQEHHVLDPDKTIYDEIADTYPGMTITKIRNVLAAFLFTGDDVFKLIRDCSGGERGRISLAKLMLSNANFLILDEPTNHLDIDSKEILENALNNYTGTLLYVSHDRYFINQTASRILELENQTLTEYLGNYDYYQEKKAERFGVKEFTSTLAGRAEQLQSAPKVESEAKLDWAESKKEQARIRKLENDLAKTESAIETLETKISDLETEMASPEVCTNVGRLNELSKECESVKEELTKLYDTWEEISSQLG
jgi:ATP-binding cassette subfamily F protein 3